MDLNMRITRRQARQWTWEKTVTLALIGLVVVVVVVYDVVVVLFFKDPNATLSNTIYIASKKAPIVPFVFGLICGHLFWPVSHFQYRYGGYDKVACSGYSVSQLLHSGDEEYSDGVRD